VRTALIALWGLLFFLVVEVAVFLPIYLLGLVLVPILARYGGRVERPSIFPGKPPAMCWTILTADALFGNREDGILGDEPWQARGGTIYGWFLRNPVCNMRFWPVVSTLPDPGVKSIGTLDEVPPNGVPGWFMAWRGPYVGFLWQNEKWGVWAGWKLNPRDARYVPANDYRRFGIGTAAQFMRF